MLDYMFCEGSMIGDQIRRCRKLKGLTLKQLSTKTGSTTGSLSHIESGTRNPSINMVEKIAYALGVTHEQLITGCFFNDESDKYDYVIKTVKKMDLDQLTTVEKILKGLYPELFN